MWNENTYPFANFNGVTVEVWEWIRNFIPHSILYVITYPCPNGTRKHGPSFVSTYTVRCRWNAVKFLPKLHKRHPVARPSGVCFVSSVTELCSAAVIAVLNVSSRYIRQRYSGTRIHTHTYIYIYEKWCDKETVSYNRISRIILAKEVYIDDQHYNLKQVINEHRY